jgi:hypothetical protein
VLSYPYLIALWSLLRSVSLRAEVISEEKLGVEFRLEEQKGYLELSLPEPQPLESSLQYIEALLRYRISCRILNDPIVLENIEDCVALRLLAPVFGKTIEDAYLKGKFAHASILGRKREWRLEECPEYSKLVASHAILEGYRISEVPGSHYWVTAPSGIQRVTTLMTCSCESGLEGCVHLMLTRELRLLKRDEELNQLIKIQSV